MENQFAEFYQNFIQSSLFPKELEDFNKALKTLNLTLENFLDLLLDLDNHLIEVDGEIILDLSNLAQCKLIKTLGSYENSKLKMDKEAIKTLNQHLLVFFAAVKNNNYKKGFVNDDYNRKVENANKVVFERFVHLNNTPKEDTEFKGQQSFILKVHLNGVKFSNILKALKSNNLISNKTTVDNFENIFLGLSIPKEDRVDWTGTRKALSVFVKALKHKLRDDAYIYDITLRCFTIEGKDIIKTTEISNASGTTPKAQILKDIVELF